MHCKRLLDAFPRGTPLGPAASSARLRDIPAGGDHASSAVSILIPMGREILEKGEGTWTQKYVYQKWPEKIFPMANFVFSHDGHFGLQGWGGVQGMVPPSPPMVYGHWVTGPGLKGRYQKMAEVPEAKNAATGDEGPAMGSLARPRRCHCHGCGWWVADGGWKIIAAG